MPLRGEFKKAYNRRYAELHPDKLRDGRRAAIVRRAMRTGRLPTRHSIEVHGIKEEELVWILTEALKRHKEGMPTPER